MSDSDSSGNDTVLPGNPPTIGTDPQGWIPAIRDILDGTSDNILTSRILGHDWIVFDAGSNTAWDPYWGSPWDYWHPLDSAHADWNTLTIYRKIKVSDQMEYFELRRAAFNFYAPSGDLSPSKQAQKFVEDSTSVINDIQNNTALDGASFTSASDMFSNITLALLGAQNVMGYWMAVTGGDGSQFQGTAAEMVMWALHDLQYGFGDLRYTMMNPSDWSVLLDDVATAITTFKSALTTAWTTYLASPYPDPNTLVKAVIDSIVSQVSTNDHANDWDQNPLDDWTAAWNFTFSDLSLTGTYNLLNADGWSQLNTDVMTLWSGPLDTLEQAAIAATTALNTAMDNLWRALGRGVHQPAHIPPPGSQNPDFGNLDLGNTPNTDMPNIDTGANGPDIGNLGDSGLGPGGVDTGGLDTGGLDTGAGLGPGGVDTGGLDTGAGLGPGGLDTGGLDTGNSLSTGGGVDTGGLGDLSGASTGDIGGLGTGDLSTGSLGDLGGGAGIDGLGSGDLGTGGLGTGGLGDGSGLGDLGSIGSGALGAGLVGAGAGLGTGGLAGSGGGSRSIGSLSSGGAGDNGAGDMLEPGQISTDGLSPAGLVEGPGSIVGPLGSTPAGYTPQGAFADLFGPEGQQFAQALAAQGMTPSGTGAATELATTSSGMPYMPMGGMGGGAGGRDQEKERERTTWLAEDESVWGLRREVAAAVVGADEAEPGDDYERPTRRPATRPTRSPSVPVRPSTPH